MSALTPKWDTKWDTKWDKQCAQAVTLMVLIMPESNELPTTVLA